MDALHEGDPERIGPYHVEARLGAGGMGRVFLATDQDDIQVAVKLMNREFAGKSEFRVRFAREAASASAVDGDHVAHIVDSDPDADPPWLATEYIPGLTLQQLVERDGVLDVAALRSLGSGLLAGLTEIHSRELVHRDLKPSNVIMAADGPRIIDFGIARAADATTLTVTGVVIGTYGFMSPEQIAADEVSPASDVFALGCVLAFAATGKSPFDATTLPAIVHRVTSQEPDLDDVPAELREVIAACLAKAPDDRPSLAAVAAGLHGTLLEATKIDPRQADDTKRWRPGRRALLGVAGLAALAVPAALWASSRTANPDTSKKDKAVDPTFTIQPAAESVALSGDGRTLAVASAIGSIRLWDTASFEETQAAFKHQVFGHIQFIPGDDSTLLCAAGEFQLWRTTSDELETLMDGKRVDAFTFNRDGTTLAVIDGYRIRTVDIASREETLVHNEWLPSADSLRFSPDERYLIRWEQSLSSKGMKILDLAGGDMEEFAGASIGAAAFTPDSAAIAFTQTTEDIGSSVQLKSIESGDTVQVSNEKAFALRFVQDGKKLVIGAESGLYMWDTDTAELTEITDGEVRTMRVSADESVIAMDGDAGIRVWDGETDNITVYDDTKGNKLAGLSSDGTLLVGLSDGGVNLWQR